MSLRTLLEFFLAGVLYPIWLIAGAADYLCHRRTDIARTSGTTESWFHVAQFASLAVLMVCAVLLEVTSIVILMMGIAAFAHTLLSYADVSFTVRRRYISPLEQHVHGLLSVVPMIAVGLIVLLHWDAWQVSEEAALRLKDQPFGTLEISLLLGSFFLLAGVPILEELLRTYRAADSVPVPSARAPR
jgi:hypothetical protein